MLHVKFKNRHEWRGEKVGMARVQAGGHAAGLLARQEFQEVQKLLASVYAAIRHDETAVRVVDRELKEKLGVGKQDE